MAGNRKVNIGRVLSANMDKTVVVAVERYRTHRLYKRRIKRITKIKAHDYKNSCKNGDTVRIEETKPLSREKRWRVTEIMARLEVAETLVNDVSKTTDGVKK